MALLDFLNPIGGLVAGVSKIIGQLKLDPQEKLKADLELHVLALNAEKDIRESQFKLEELATKDLANLREQIKIELQSEDAYVRRARPSWLYMLLGIYGANYLLVPLVAMFRFVEPFPIPNEVHMLTGASFLGYSFMRSFYDKNGKNGH